MPRILYALAALLLTAASAFAGGRVALVIGNSAYLNVSQLANPRNDATALAKALRDAGFDKVIEEGDLDQAALRRVLKDFSALARGADAAVVYYAGHGVEVAGTNYLVPVDATLAQSTDIAFEAIPLDALRTAVSGATNLRLIILDACRNNPFKLAASDGKRSVGRGLARVEPDANELIAYAAREGTVANDGLGGNSPYASALVKHLSVPGLEIRLLFGQIRDDVVAATGGTQEPFIYGTLGGKPVVLNTKAVAAAPASEPAPPPPASADPLVSEAATAWVAVKDTTSVAVLKAYISRYQGTVFGDLAVARLGELQTTAVAPEPEPPSAEPPAVPKESLEANAAPPPAEPPAPVEARTLSIDPGFAPVGKWAEGAAFDGRSLWVSESGQRTIAEVDPTNGAVVRRLTVGRLPVGLEAAADGTLYALVHTDKTVWVKPPGAGKGKRLAALKDCPQDLAVTDKAVWVLSQPDCSTVDSRVVVVNRTTGKQAPTVGLGEWGQAIAAGHGRIWVAHARHGLVNVIDPASLAVEDIVVDGASFWDVGVNSDRVFLGGRIGEDNGRGLLVAIDPVTRAEVGRQEFDQMINAVVADEDSVVAIGIDGAIWVLSPDTLSIERVITLTTGPFRPSDALILGNQLVIACQQCDAENGALLTVGDIR